MMQIAVTPMSDQNVTVKTKTIFYDCCALYLRAIQIQKSIKLLFPRAEN